MYYAPTELMTERQMRKKMQLEDELIKARKLTKPENVKKMYCDIGIQFDNSVPAARMLNFI